MPARIMRAIKRLKTGICDQSGLALLEALVSALLLTIVAAGTFSYFSASTRATAQERHRAQANNLAEADLERLRSMPVTCPKTAPTCTYSVASIVGTPQSQTVTQDGTPYTVVSRAQYQNDPSISSDCSAGAGSRDYVAISSTVTWPDIGARPPVTASSIVTPPSGSFVPNTGSLRINVVDSRGNPISGATLTGSGISPTQGSFSGTTNSAGCVLWKSVASGNYSLVVAGVAGGMVDKDGNPPNQPQPAQIGVVDQNSTTVDLTPYDRPGSAAVSFSTRNYSNQLVSASFDSMVFVQSGMTSQSRLFPPAPAPAAATINATQLFPFVSPYSAFAGTCTGSSTSAPGDNPNPTSLVSPPAPAAIPSFTVPVGGSASPQTIQMPALLLTVYKGTNTSSAVAPNATVKVRDVNCSNYLRMYATNTSGRLDQPGLPYSDFSVCASGPDVNGTTRRISPANPSLNDGQTDLDTGTALNLFLQSGTTSGGGLCP
jgi:Tfp pilus assembly protein PilV